MISLRSLFIFLLATTVGKSTVGPFLEPEAPFFASALVIETETKTIKIRRGILIPLGEDRWACFDTDLLHWAAFWRAPEGKPPLTLDSMAAISYPEGKAKATRAPKLQGDLVFLSHEFPGEGQREAQRESLVNEGKGPVGPLAPKRGRWLGLELRGDTPVLRYRVQDAEVEEFLQCDGSVNFCRVLRISPHTKALDFRIHSAFGKHDGRGKIVSKGFLHLAPSRVASTIVLGTKSASAVSFPEKQPADPAFPTTFKAINPGSAMQGVYRVRPLAIPQSSRYIRPTDLAFLSDGTGLLATLDGDVWRIETPEATTSRWTRIASGLFETISIETTPDDRIFTLGRDQITELIDTNGDHHIDYYRNASNAFLQTLQTRDYATSLAIDKEGSFLIAKGGIHTITAKSDNELSSHRGTILRIAADGNSAKILADGLRLPYVGLRSDGAVFASDQQGHFIPSTPVHLIKDDRPFLGFAPTNFRNLEPVPPLVWYPYQANRSAAAFAQWGGLFLQVSWGGRLFAVETPKTGQPFSWQLPIQLDFPSLNATRHPISGRLYAVGLGISGYQPTTPDLLGMASIEEVKSFPKPVSFDARSRQITVTFDREFAEHEVLVPSSPALRLFDIKRTADYGSGHYRWDGKAGEFRDQPKGFAFSEDRRTFVLEFDQVIQANLLVLHLTLASGETTIPLQIFARADHLGAADFHGLAVLKRDEPDLVAGNAVKGEPLFTNFACAGCHSLDGARLVGPTLKGIASRADEKHLRQSILEPNAVITKGFPAAMPSFAGMLTDQQLEDLLAYLKTLR